MHLIGLLKQSDVGLCDDMWAYVRVCIATYRNTVNTPKNMASDHPDFHAQPEKEWWDMNTHDEFYWPIALAFTVLILIKIVCPSLYGWYKNRK